MSDDFYKAFEDKHRGDRKLIRSRLQVYLPFVEPLKEIYQHNQTIDLGCGRGEWLELLTEQGGFDAHGIDLDEGMLAACDEYNLQYTLQDALTCLEKLEDESQALVTAFHLAEHIPFIDLQMLIKEALRVLKPAGLLILETPNPENITVGTSEFYMDPTHKQPLPPNLLAFIPSYYGFQKTIIARLQEPDSFKDSDKIQLIDVLKGVSPDYAVIAQKEAPEKLVSKFNLAFNKTYGLTLETLAEKYKQQFIRNEQELNLKLSQIKTKIEQAEAKILTVEAETQIAKTEAQIANKGLEALLNSSSWKVTKPIRACVELIKRVLK